GTQSGECLASVLSGTLGKRTMERSGQSDDHARLAKSVRREVHHGTTEFEPVVPYRELASREDTTEEHRTAERSAIRSPREILCEQATCHSTGAFGEIWQRSGSAFDASLLDRVAKGRCQLPQCVELCVLCSHDQGACAGLTP